MPSIPAADWYERAAREIVRNSYTLFRWANENNKGLTTRECENISRTKEFQAVIRAERNKFYKELATDPSRNRNVAVGQLLFAIQRLLEVESYDKAVAAVAQLAKMEGWTSEAASNVNIFQDLNAKDFDALRRKLEPKKASVTTLEN